jgi:phosphonate transport system substrate-binding protein
VSRAGCPRGDLDNAYGDRDGDLVADTPAQTVNPSTLIFAYTPVEDPAVYTKVWDGFIKHMEKVTGKKVVFFPVQSNAAEIEAMRSGRLHIAGFNTGSNPIAVNCAGFLPLAIMAGKDGAFGYEMEIIVPADSAIKTPADIKGKKLAFTAPTSNSGFKAPSALLESEFNLIAKRDYEPVFSGKHDNSVLGVANKDYDAAAIANEVMFRMFERNVVDKAKIRRSTNRKLSRPPAMALRTILIRPCKPRSRNPSSPSRGKAHRSRPSSRARINLFRSPTRKIGASSARSTRRAV